ncbi:hypothetical protein [Alkalihalophilus marmarensis]|uniref:hypothetical protein n=1 Tax=Alkalihalophilus marmarensis TaxID=521377 RepID=UPI002E2484E4|nr:hypothetical protein [Alkalihalophilus marmarensis]
MQFSLHVPMNVIDLVGTVLSWGIFIYFIYYFYQKQEKEPTLWKACLAAFAGVISFNINTTMFHTDLSLPILPIGVWLLLWYASTRKNGAWERYRPFAWLGFLSNYVTIVIMILSLAIHNLVFPKDDLTTFIANYEHAELMATHPSADEVILDVERLEQQLPLFEQSSLMDLSWYEEIAYGERSEQNEQFPYMLTGTYTKWGSGLPAILYVERDGKGILIELPDEQRYFRADDSVLKGGGIE